MVKPVYALVGDDVYLQLQAIAEIARQVSPDATKIDFDGESAELANVLDELRSFSMFGGDTKLVTVRNGDDFVTKFREPLEDYVAAPSTSAVLILRMTSLPKTQRIAKAIDKIGQIIACEPPKMAQLPMWITKHARSAHELEVAPAAATMLADLIGTDLGRLDNELAKIALIVDSGRAEAKDIAGAVSFQREQEMQVLVQAMTAGDAREAIRRWKQLTESDATSEFRAVVWLSGWLSDVAKGVALRKKRVPDAAIAKACRIWDFKLLGPFLKTVDALGENGVARAIDLLADLDRRSKSGLGDAVGNVERFIVSLADAARARPATATP